MSGALQHYLGEAISEASGSEAESSFVADPRIEAKRTAYARPGMVVLD